MTQTANGPGKRCRRQGIPWHVAESNKWLTVGSGLQLEERWARKEWVQETLEWEQRPRGGKERKVKWIQRGNSEKDALSWETFKNDRSQCVATMVCCRIGKWTLAAQRSFEIRTTLVVTNEESSCQQLESSRKSWRSKMTAQLRRLIGGISRNEEVFVEGLWWRA